MTNVAPRPLVLLLLAAAALVATAHTEALKCSEARSSTKANPVILSLDPQATRSIRFTAPMGRVAWNAVFALGEGYGGNLTPHIKLDLKNPKPTSYFLHVKLYKVQPSATLLSQRVPSAWLNNGGQATLYIGESSFTIAFQRPNEKDRKLLLELTDPQIEGIDAVQVEGDLKVEECEGPERIPETTTTSTTSPTTTTVPTTEPTTTTTTTTTITTTPATTTSSPTTTTVATTSTTTEIFTTTGDETTSDTTTTKEDESPHTCLPTEDSDAGPGVTTICTPAATESVMVLGSEEDCQLVLRLAWACGALALVFFLFILILIAYSIILYRRSWKRGQGLRANNSGGFGMTASDMYYYEMKNPNLTIGNTVPRIRTPRHSSSPGLSPSHSTCRLSDNYPTNPSPTPNTLSLPATKFGDSVSDIAAPQDKSRNSKVSFADD